MVTIGNGAELYITGPFRYASRPKVVEYKVYNFSPAEKTGIPFGLITFSPGTVSKQVLERDPIVCPKNPEQHLDDVALRLWDDGNFNRTIKESI